MVRTGILFEVSFHKYFRMAKATDIMSALLFLVIIAGCSQSANNSNKEGSGSQRTDIRSEAPNEPEKPSINLSSIDPTKISTPAELAQYLNNQATWSKGEKITFEGLNSCGPIHEDLQADPERLRQLEAEYAQARKEVELDLNNDIRNAELGKKKDELGNLIQKQYLEREKGDQIGYKCNDGFATIESPMGIKVCDLEIVGYGFRGVRYEYLNKNCRWRN